MTKIQPLLIEIQENDDLWLQEQDGLVWFHLLKNMSWEPLVPLASHYYQALYDFNVEQAQKRAAAAALKPNPESQYEATLRLLEERPTESDNLCALHPVFFEQGETPNVPVQLAPGLVPIRSAGRQPKDFFAMFKAFVAMSLMGKPSEPETVYQELQNNPAFARTCGFSLPSKENGYRQSDFPTLRKIEQFDQIMTNAGLWSHAAIVQVKRNLESGKIVAENKLVHDTTHFDAYSTMHTVHKEEVDGSITKKSQSATIKNCRCPDWHNCPHEWISSDAGAGTVTKTGGIMHWAHKASTLGLAEQGILIDAIAMTDAASHDSTSVVPQLARVFELYPELKTSVKVVLDDGAADDGGLKRQVEEEFGIKLLASVNPRGRKPLTTNLPKGMDHITPLGTPVCHAGYPFDLLGVRTETDKFIFRAPNDENGNPVCHDCDKKIGCFRGTKGARTIEIPFEQLPWLDPEFPQNSIRFRKIMAKRTVIERLHKLMKYDFGSGSLTKRGNHSFQATLDKTLLAMHLVIEHT